jgi:glycosyltransferase involved in cell wall biosynthesis
MQPLLRSTVDLFLPVSQAVAAGNELPERRLAYEVVPNFVPDNVAAAGDHVSSELNWLPDQPFLLFVGALRPHKGIRVLMEAYERLSPRPPLVLIGTRWVDTPQSFPSGVLVREDVPHGTVMAAWQRASIGIVPSLAPDPCPTVALEAMAVGTPVIGTRTGGLIDMVQDGVTGRLVTPGDPDELARAIASLIGNEEQRRAMGAASQQAVRPFTASVVVSQVDGIYHRLAA